ncbi:hypothetical protein [Roseicella frigidaeris]|uniref:hypothetical protein n=1 Tax=Roseicella frigidaeris TaxID=2230885 RepID=UPI000FDE437E|nr:hypothetical protein [Roseicella frigidaeris]
MPKRDVEADIAGRLEAFLHDGRRLPATKDGKVNVLALCHTLGLPVADAQHFYKKDSLKAAVNAIAREHRLLPIGARVEAAVADKIVEDRIAATARRAAEDGRAATEATVANEALMENLREARAEIARLRLENTALQERLRLLAEQGSTWDLT